MQGTHRTAPTPILLSVYTRHLAPQDYVPNMTPIQLFNDVTVCVLAIRTNRFSKRRPDSLPGAY